MDRLLRELKDFLLAFILALLIYKGLGIALATPIPLTSVTSISMLPSLHPGDLVVVAGTKSPKVGDIVIYSADCPLLPKEDVIHRVIEINETHLITKGDNNLTNPKPDPCPVRLDQVKGKVVLAIPILGYPRLLLYYTLGI